MLFEAKALTKVIYKKKNTHTHKTCYEHGGYSSKRPQTGGSTQKGSFFVVVFNLPEYKRLVGSLKWKDMKQQRNLSFRFKKGPEKRLEIHFLAIKETRKLPGLVIYSH